MTPAFSPGPWITHGAFVGSPRRWMREDLYEQCSFHIAEKMPSSVKVGALPISFRMRAYSSGLRPWDATSSGVIWGSFGIMLLGRCRLLLKQDQGPGKGAFSVYFRRTRRVGKGASRAVPTIVLSECEDGMVGTRPDASASVRFAHPTQLRS